jgi:hypothetical protein
MTSDYNAKYYNQTKSNGNCIYELPLQPGEETLIT